MSRGFLLSLLLVAFLSALLASPVASLRSDDDVVEDLASEASNEEVDYLAAEDAADEASGASLQEEAAPSRSLSSSSSSSAAAAAAAPADTVAELKKQIKALSSEDDFSIDAFAHADDNNKKSSVESKKAEVERPEFTISSSSKATPTGLVVSHSARVEAPTYNPSKHRGQRALKFYCDFKHCHPHGRACFKSCTKLREGQPRIDCHAHCNAVRRKCFDCCGKAKLPKGIHGATEHRQAVENAIKSCNGYTEFCLEYPPPPGVTDATTWVRSACISIQKK